MKFYRQTKFYLLIRELAETFVLDDSLSSFRMNGSDSIAGLLNSTIVTFTFPDLLIIDFPSASLIVTRDVNLILLFAPLNASEILERTATR